MLPPKSRPRYLPTLTHVVTAARLVANDLPDVYASEGALHEENEPLVQQIVQTLMPLVRLRIRESLQQLIEEQLHHLEANMQLEVESMVRRSVNECNNAPS